MGKDSKMIRLEDVHKSFGDLEVLKGINLHVKEGEKLVIIGPSGSGKSTLIRCINVRNTIPAAALALVGSWLGAMMAMRLSDDFIRIAMLVLLPVMAFYVLRSKRLSGEEGSEYPPKKTIPFCYLIYFTWNKSMKSTEKYIIKSLCDYLYRDWLSIECVGVLLNFRISFYMQVHIYN